MSHMLSSWLDTRFCPEDPVLGVQTHHTNVTVVRKEPSNAVARVLGTWGQLTSPNK